MAAGAKVKLPQIIHPAHRRANTDIGLLKLTGKTLVPPNNDELHCNVKEKILPANKKRGTCIHQILLIMQFFLLFSSAIICSNQYTIQTATICYKTIT